MNDLTKTHYSFDANPHWSNPLPEYFIEENKHIIFSSLCTKLFDQNGYDLCPLEQMYAKFNETTTTVHRHKKHISIQRPWFLQLDEKLTGYVLNHSMMFERKGYTGPALEQLLTFAKKNPLIYKVIQVKPKWGLDFSMDYVDETGNCFEIFHHEYDSFVLEDVIKMKKIMEEKIESVDFDYVAKDLIERKKEWLNLEFFEQSEWKCKYFELPNERFKMVVWQE